MKSVFLSTILLVPLLLTGCVGGGVDVGGYYPGYDDGPYYGRAVGVYYDNNGPYYAHHDHHYDRGYRHGGSTIAVHSGGHFTGTRTAGVSSSGHASSAHISASVRR